MRFIAIACILAATTLLAWLFFEDGGSVLPMEVQAEAAQERVFSAAPSADLPHDEKVENSDAPGGQDARKAEITPGGNSTAIIQVQLAELKSKAPISGLTVKVYELKEFGSDINAPLLEEESEANGRVEFTVPSEKKLFLIVDGVGEFDYFKTEFASQFVMIDALNPKEVYEVNLGVLAIPEVAFCQVQDALTGLALHEAFLIPVSDWKQTSILYPQPGENSISANMEGLIEVPRSGENSLPYWVCSPGYSPSIFNADYDSPTAETASIQRLLPCASLEVSVFDKAGLIPQAEVEVSLASDSVKRDIFFFNPRGRRVKEQSGSWMWSGISNPRGARYFEFLPAGLKLQVKIRKSASEPWIQQDDLALVANGMRKIDYWMAPPAKIVGSLLLPTGEPVGNQEIWLTRPRNSFMADIVPRYFDESDGHKLMGSDGMQFSAPGIGGKIVVKDSSHGQRVMTNGAGKFTFEGVTPGDWIIGPGFPSADSFHPNICAHAKPIRIAPKDEIVEIHLQAERGKFIQGVVLTPFEERVGDAWVGFSDEPLQVGGFGVKANPEGEFRIGPLGRGKFQVAASHHSFDEEVNWASSDRVLVEAGEPPIQLYLREGCTLRGRVIDAITAEPLASEIHAYESKIKLGHWTGTGYAGTFELDSLIEGSWTVTAIGAHKQIGFVTGINLQPGKTTDEVEIPLQPGATLLVRYLGEIKSVKCAVFSGGTLVVETYLKDGALKEICVPAGSNRVVISAREKTLDTSSLFMKAGEDHYLVF